LMVPLVNQDQTVLLVCLVILHQYRSIILVHASHVRMDPPAHEAHQDHKAQREHEDQTVKMEPPAAIIARLHLETQVPLVQLVDPVDKDRKVTVDKMEPEEREDPLVPKAPSETLVPLVHQAHQVQLVKPLLKVVVKVLKVQLAEKENLDPGVKPARLVDQANLVRMELIVRAQEEFLPRKIEFSEFIKC